MSLPGSSSSISSSGRNAGSRVALVLLLLLALGSCRETADVVEMRVGGHEFSVELAVTPEERRVGLSNRPELPERGGMLFVFPDTDYRSFWMKDTSLPLSIAFIGADGVIREIYNMEPFSLERINSRAPAKYALEVRRGTFDELGITPGDRVQLPQAVTSLQ